MKKKQNKLIKILLTGGHAATTAVAVVEELSKRKTEKNNWEIFWIGSKKAVEGKNIPTLESEILPKLGVKVFSIITGRVQRRFTFWTLPSLIKIPIGFIHAFILLKKIKPQIIVSFGGFAAFPVVVVGHFLKMPIILHEQTMAIGRANKYSSFFVDKIAIARSDSQALFPKGKTILVGNPIMSEILKIRPKEKLGSPPVIFITAGSRGSETINDFIKDILKKLLEDFLVVHQTGFLDFERFNKLKMDLPLNLKKRYEPYSTIDPFKMSSFYQRSDIIIARAGANTISEIMATKRPALLIPLPFAFQDEQRKNAFFAQDYGIAKVLDQERLSSEELLAEIYMIKENWQKILMNIKNKPCPDEKAAFKLVNLIEKTV